MKQIEIITIENFREFGEVIAFPPEDKTNFYIVDTDNKNPWRIAVFRYWNHSVQRLECHPSSKESFEPLSGVTLLFVAGHETPEDYHVFLLDKPVVLKKGIWHQTLTVTDEAQVKITENLEVESVFYDLDREVSLLVG